MSALEVFIKRMDEDLAQMRSQVEGVERAFRAASERIKTEFDEEWMNISSEFRTAGDELRALKFVDQSVREEMQSEMLLAWKNLGRRVDEFRLRISDE